METSLWAFQVGAAPKGSAGWWYSQSAHRSGAVHNSSQWAQRYLPWTSFLPLRPSIGLHLRALPDLNSLKEPSKQGSIYSCWYRRSWVISALQLREKKYVYRCEERQMQLCNPSSPQPIHVALCVLVSRAVEPVIKM